MAKQNALHDDVDYVRSPSTPSLRKVRVGLKKYDTGLDLEIPDFNMSHSTNENHDPISARENDVNSHLTGVLPSHFAFRRLLQTATVSSKQLEERSRTDLISIGTIFPNIQRDDIRIVFAAWIAFACVMDDHLETLQPQVGIASLQAAIHILNPYNSPDEETQYVDASKDVTIQHMTRAFEAHCSRLLSVGSRETFFQAVRSMLEAHVEECRYVERGAFTDVSTYMTIRRRTIALGPFFELIKSEYVQETDLSDPAWESLQFHVCTAAGLQNDLVGLERDMEKEEVLNAVLIETRARQTTSYSISSHDLLAASVAYVGQQHNLAIQSSLEAFSRLCQTHSPYFVQEVARKILTVCNTHLMWCMSNSRYKTKIDQVSTPASDPVQLLRSDGILLGLPFYRPTQKTHRQTALVTGATGVSGYHMVKVLAASERWTKIYCLSRRPPPDTFFTDLGADAGKVEHLAVDFLDEPKKIERTLESTISNIDHVFYFSYMQPPPKGETSSLWSNADEINSFNVTLLDNFLATLGHSSLKPKRFMLQTGSKHYGFYLGPATVPAFESDPRVTLDNNFYYAQEDAVAKYCKSVGCQWNVARPSWIVGAVRESQLNHLLGIGIYAAVQAHLGRPLRFPGDYYAWDREQVQSTGMLNAHFEEWLVLSEHTANEAFNIHDGQSFTWGRLWPSLARWYGVKWEPPEKDEAKYRAMKSSVMQMPRGYGPQATMRSTFTLLEWSRQPEVEEAWRNLSRHHGLILNPFQHEYRARIFSLTDAALIGETPMTLSIRKARQYGFFGTVDSYHSIFNTFHEMGRLKLTLPPTVDWDVE